MAIEPERAEVEVGELDRPLPRWRRLVRPALIVLVAVVVAYVAFGLGLANHVTDKERLQRTVEDAGVIGPIVFVGLMVLLVPLNIPGLLFVIPSTTLFGPFWGIVLSLIGGFIASAVGVVGARHLGRDAFESKMPARIRRFEERLSTRGFWAVVLLRMFTFLAQPVDWLCGLSSMRMRTVLSATFVGLVPPTVVIALSGKGIVGLL